MLTGYLLVTPIDLLKLGASEMGKTLGLSDFELGLVVHGRLVGRRISKIVILLGLSLTHLEGLRRTFKGERKSNAALARCAS